MTAQPAKVYEVAPTPSPATKPPVGLTPFGRRDFNDLSRGAMLLYGAIEARAYDRSNGWKSTIISQKALAACIHYSTESVRLFTLELERAGWIAKTKSGGTIGQCYEYFILKHAKHEDRRAEDVPVPVWSEEDHERYSAAVRYWQGLRAELRGIVEKLTGEEGEFEGRAGLVARKREIETEIANHAEERRQGKNEQDDFFCSYSLDPTPKPFGPHPQATWTPPPRHLDLSPRHLDLEAKWLGA